MHILFLENNPRWIYGLPNGFRDIGHKVEILKDLSKETLLSTITNFKPHLIFSLGWSSEENNKKIQLMRKYIKASNIPYIYWATEDPGYTHSFTIPFIQQTQPDFIFTICQKRINYYRKLGLKAAYLDFGYHESVHYPAKCEIKYKSNIAIVANAYPKFLKDHPDSFRLKSIKILIEPVLKENFSIAFWGNDWDKMNSILEYEIPKECIRNFIPYTEANKIYSSSDIIIGIQNQILNPQVCQRTYEILGSQGFLITSDTPGIRSLFTPNHDLIVSSSPEETSKLIRYYLENPSEREKIRINGKRSVEKYSYKYRAQYIIEILINHHILSKNDL